MKVSLDELNIYEIENFYTKLLKEVQNSKSSFTLNFDKVEKIDLNGVQLLLSLKKHCEQNNITLKLTNINSNQIKQTISLLNLTDELGIK